MVDVGPIGRTRRPVGGPPGILRGESEVVEHHGHVLVGYRFAQAERHHPLELFGIRVGDDGFRHDDRAVAITAGQEIDGGAPDLGAVDDDQATIALLCHGERDSVVGQPRPDLVDLALGGLAQHHAYQLNVIHFEAQTVAVAMSIGSRRVGGVGSVVG